MYRVCGFVSRGMWIMWKGVDMVCGLWYTRERVCGLILDKEQHEDYISKNNNKSIFNYFYHVNS